MLTVTGIVALLFGGLLYAGQCISTLDFGLAQRLGLQERADAADPLFSHLERNTARWDLLVLWTLPLAGVLMLVGHAWWPYVALAAGGISIDTGGREAVKLLGLRDKGVRVGSAREVRLALGAYAGFVVVGLWVATAGVFALS